MVSKLTLASYSRHNQLGSLPESVGRLRRLEVLNLSNNKLGSPGWVEAALAAAGGSPSNPAADLPGLARSDGSRAMRRGGPLPFSLKHLVKLRVLDLEENPDLVEPPPDILQTSAQAVVRYMKGVEALLDGDAVDIAGAGLRYFPHLFIRWSLACRDGEVDGGDSGGAIDIAGAGLKKPIRKLILDNNLLRNLPDVHRGQYTVHPMFARTIFAYPTFGVIRHLSQSSHMIMYPSPTTDPEGACCAGMCIHFSRIFLTMHSS